MVVLDVLVVHDVLVVCGCVLLCAVMCVYVRLCACMCPAGRTYSIIAATPGDRDDWMQIIARQLHKLVGVCARVWV